MHHPLRHAANGSQFLPQLSLVFHQHLHDRYYLFHSGKYNDREYFSQICLGNVIANILVYYLIEYMGAGFAIVCSYFQEKEEVGFLYQKTLGISFLICVVMTPVIYLSDKILRVLDFGKE